jgi:hypothetical protein
MRHATAEHGARGIARGSVRFQVVTDLFVKKALDPDGCGEAAKDSSLAWFKMFEHLDRLPQSAAFCVIVKRLTGILCRRSA